MRESLKDLEGAVVFFEATVFTWNKHPGPSDDFLLKPIKIWPWDQNSPVGQGEPIKLDHLWYRCPKNDRSEGLERLASVTGIAVVTSYARSDGSWDYGIRHVLPSRSIDWAIAIEMGEPLSGKSGLALEEARSQSLQEMLSLLEQGKKGEVFCYSRVYAVDDLHKITEATLKATKRNLQANHSRLATSHKAGKPQGLDLKVPKCRRRSALAFG